MNDKPLMAAYKGELLFPIFRDYPEEKFGGFLAVTDYKDPFVQKEIEQNGWMIWPPVRYSYDTYDVYLPAAAPTPPSWRLPRDVRCQGFPGGAHNPNCRLSNWHWLGTDDQGRDVLARALYGFRLSLVFGVSLTLAASLIGIFAGALQGFYGGWTDMLFQRFIEIWTAIPTLYVILIASSFLIPGFWVLFGIFLAFSWVALVGVVRAEFLRVRNFEYIQAARAMGVSDAMIMYRHMLPNAMVATLTFLPFILNGAITTLTALDFLGFGMPPGAPSLGELLSQGKENLHMPWLGLSSVFVLASMLILLIFIGEAVRDAFDPHANPDT